jgi:hypothetical protein
MSGVGRLNEHQAPGRRSIRVRLLLLALLPLAVVLPVLLAVLAIWGGDYLDRLLITSTPISCCHGYFERVSKAVAGQPASSNDWCAPVAPVAERIGATATA